MSDVEERVRDILNSIVKEKFPNASQVQIKYISSDGANYSSALFEVSVITPEGTHELFAKVASMGKNLNDASKQIFNTEKFVLTSLSNTYEKLQDKHAMTERFIFPKFYNDNHFDGAPIVVMENLSTKGYTCYDRFKSINWSYASKSVETLARFHALSFALKKECPEDFTKAGDVMKMPISAMTDPQWDGLITGAIAVVDKEDREKLTSLLEGAVGFSKMMDLSEPRKTSVIIHGDYRASNLMHKQVNGEYHVIPVDYQTTRLGCPVADLLYFVLMGSDQQFRQQHFHQLMDHYYKHLALTMIQLGMKPDAVYGREEFESDLRAKLPISLCVAATVLPFVTVDAASAPCFERNEYFPRANELFAERFRGLMQDFKKWGFI